MLYKYLRPERVDVLKSLEIRFTQPNALNDPFDLRPRIESLIPEAEVLANYSGTPVDFDPILRLAYSMLPKEQRSLLPYETAAAAFKSFMGTDRGRSAVSEGLLRFLRFNAHAVAPLCESLYEALNRGVGILSLTEVPDDPLMWACYGESHRGLLIGFDEEHAFFNRRRSDKDEFYFLRRVIYADLPAAPSALGVDGNALFVTKGTKWSNEQEWRMFAPLKDCSRSIEIAWRHCAPIRAPSAGPGLYCDWCSCDCRTRTLRARYRPRERRPCTPLGITGCPGSRWPASVSARLRAVIHCQKLRVAVD